MYFNTKRIGFFRSSKYLIILLPVFIAFSSCDKDKPTSKPSIDFIKDSGYVWSDTTIKTGTQIKVGITASDNEANITYFNINTDNGTIQTALDSGMNSQSLVYSRIIIKSNSQAERWIFTVMDKNRNKASIFLTINKAASSVYGDIITYPSVILGAQNNLTTRGFFSLKNGSIYNLEQAFTKQDSIDIIYYYHSTYNSILSSPNENEVSGYFTGTYGITNWTVKNETLYDTTSVTTTAFDESINDSLLLSVYDAVNGKRKAKYLSPGMIISFKNAANKIGLIKIVSVNGTDAGTVEMAIKVQK